MSIARSLSWLALLVLGLLAFNAQAQRMYRCGNAYQDRPCEGGQQGRVVQNWGGSASGGAGKGADVQCTRYGADAMKIIWSRDHGATKDQQLAELDAQGLPAQVREERAWLIESVYSRRGPALEVRAAIEAECVAERQRQAQAAAAAGLQGGAQPPYVPAAQGPGAADMERFESRQREEMEANQEAFRKSRCDDLARQYEQLRQQERAGGNLNSMQRFNERRRSLDERKRSEGC